MLTLNSKVALRQRFVSNYDAVKKDYNDHENWMAALNGFYAIKGLPSNYSQHYLMLTEYVNKTILALKTWHSNQSTHHSNKEVAMAMLYGMDY